MPKRKAGVSENMQKCCGVTIEGNVQDVGFRDFIENIARSHFLSGVVFNDIGSTVKIVCRQDSGVIDDFFKDVQTKGTKAGIKFKITDKKELPLEIPLPAKFTKVSTDDVEDIGRKLDKAYTELKGVNTKLASIEDDTSILPEINNGIASLNTKFDSFITQQMKILEKLIVR